MKLIEAERRFRALETQKNVYRSRDIGRLLGVGGERLRGTIRRLETAGTVRRVARDVYWHEPLTTPAWDLLEEMAATLRRGDLNYIGFESAASRWGVISQIPIDRLTIATTGREGEFSTPLGTIEFVHTEASVDEILSQTISLPHSPLRLATKSYAVEGLRRARRSLDLIDWEELLDED